MSQYLIQKTPQHHCCRDGVMFSNQNVLLISTLWQPVQPGSPACPQGQRQVHGWGRLYCQITFPPARIWWHLGSQGSLPFLLRQLCNTQQPVSKPVTRAELELSSQESPRENSCQIYKTAYLIQALLVFSHAHYRYNVGE